MAEFIVNLAILLLDILLWTRWAEDRDRYRDQWPTRILRIIISIVVLLAILGCFALFILLLVNLSTGRR